MAYIRTSLLEIKVLEISENQEMLCPFSCPEALEPFQCYRTFKPYMMREPVREKLVYTVALVEASNISNEEAEPICILPEETQVVDSSGNSFDGCGYICTILTHVLQVVHNAKFSYIEIPRGSKSRFLLVYPEVAPGRKIAKLTVSVYSFLRASMNLLARCTLNLEHRKGEKETTEEMSLGTAVSNSIGNSITERETASDNERLGQDLVELSPTKCLTCGRLLFEPERRFCSVNCLIAYNKRGRKERESTLKPESRPDEERVKQDSDRLPVATCENCGKPLFEVGRRFCSIDCLTTHTGRERAEKKSAYEPKSSLNSEHLDQGPVRFQDASCRREINLDDRRCPECGGQRLIRQGHRRELFCLDCYFVLHYE